MRWMADTAQLCAWTREPIMTAIQSSAEAAVQTCTGGENGRMCGMRWGLRQFDGGDSVNLGQEIGVLSALMTTLLFADGNQVHESSDVVSGFINPDGQATSDGAAEHGGGYADPDGYQIKPPLTHDTGGTSVGNPQAGQSKLENGHDLMSVNDVDTSMAIVLTTLVMTCFLVMFVWMGTDDVRQRKKNERRHG